MFELISGYVLNPIGVLAIYGILSIGVLVVFYFVVRAIVQKAIKVSESFRLVILLISVPREKLEGKENDETDRELIGQAKALFGVLGGIKVKKGFASYFYGRNDHFSFEMVLDSDQLISFYTAVPKPMQRFFEQQITAQYPKAVIEVKEDYNMFNPQGVVLASELKLAKPQMFPIRTYDKMESDPLSSLTNALSKFTKGEGAAIQFVIRSAEKSWHKMPAKVASAMQQGKKLEDAVRQAKGSFFHAAGKMVGDSMKSSKDQNLNTPPKEYRLSPMEEELVKALEEKTSQAGFEVNIRIIVSGPNEQLTRMKMEGILNSFVQYSTYQYGNSFKASSISANKKIVHDFIYRNFNEKGMYVLNASEMASLWHLPMPTTETPNIRWLTARKAPPPANLPKDGVILGKVVYRGEETLVRLKRDDRRRHVYIIGQTGSGKTEAMKFMALQDIQNGDGVVIIDPHGEFCEDLIPHIPKERIDDIIIFDPADIQRPMGLNMLEYTDDDEKDFAVQEMVAIFYKLFGQEMIGPMFEHYMRNAMLALMDDKETGATIVEIPRMFTDKVFRKEKLAKVKNMVVKNFWEQEYEQSQRGSQAADMLSYVISKIGRFLTNDMMRNIIGQAKSAFNFRQIMDEQKILFANLSKGKIGEVNSNLLGFIIVSKLQMAALSRAKMKAEDRKDCYLYIDEFQNYVTDSIAIILSEARKYKLDLTMAHQYVGQLVKGNDSSIRDAVFGNVGSVMAFRVGVEDAETIAKLFEPVFDENDVMNLEKHSANVRLLINSEPSRPFNIKPFALCTMPGGDPTLLEKLKQLSRLKYGRDRAIVDAEIKERSHLDQLGKVLSAAPENMK